MIATDPGLCASCQHTHRIRTRTGSTFWLCRMSEHDPRFPKYPPLPVLACIGYEQAPGPDPAESLEEG